MSSTAENKSLALQFLQLASTNAIDAAMVLLHSDVTWWVAGDPALLRVAGLKDRSHAERLLVRLRKAVPDGLRMAVVGVTAENDRVAVEIEGTGVWHNGRTYHNHYHFLFVIRESLIISVREYMDTLHLQQINS